MTFIKGHSTSTPAIWSCLPSQQLFYTNIWMTPKNTFVRYNFSLRLHRIPRVFHVQKNHWAFQVFQVCGHPDLIHYLLVSNKLLALTTGRRWWWRWLIFLGTAGQHVDPLGWRLDACTLFQRWQTFVQRKRHDRWCCLLKSCWLRWPCWQSFSYITEK